jgi:uncharacterized damage-inducible protein DinB
MAQKWFERKFTFGNDTELFSGIKNKLANAPAHLEKAFQLVPEDLLILKQKGTWSIKENIGHLIDLEPLWQGRLDDILNGEELLRPTDLANTQTDLANHNSKSVDALIEEFKDIRARTLVKLSELSVDQLSSSALHPRLLTPMNVVDLFLFVAEHDDHHIGRMMEIIG